MKLALVLCTLVVVCLLVDSAQSFFCRGCDGHLDGDLEGGGGGGDGGDIVRDGDAKKLQDDTLT